MRVVHFERLPLPGGHSIERLFREIRRALPDRFSVEVVRCPTPGHTALWLPGGIWRAWTNKGPVNHIAGDIHYVAMGLPGKRTILTVHDVNRLEDLVGLRKRLYRWLYFSLPFRRCRFVTAISEHTRQRLVQLFPWVAPKIQVIPDCVPAGLGPRPKRFNNECPRILQVGTGPHKNLERLARALEAQQCLLHIVGRLSEEQRHVLQECKVRYENEVDLTDRELARAYEEADVVAFVSLAEGFGLPIIEAQAVGRPVLTSNLSPMKDVAGDAACLVNPYSVAEIRAGILRLLLDDKYRERLIVQGYANARRFTAQEVACRYAKLYQEVLEY